MEQETLRFESEGNPARLTLLGLIRLLDEERERSEAELVETARRLIASGQVVLTGNFAGSTL